MAILGIVKKWISRQKQTDVMFGCLLFSAAESTIKMSSSGG
jgi:hypothetical protein